MLWPIIAVAGAAAYVAREPIGRAVSWLKSRSEGKPDDSQSPTGKWVKIANVWVPGAGWTMTPNGWQFQPIVGIRAGIGESVNQAKSAAPAPAKIVTDTVSPVTSVMDEEPIWIGEPNAAEPCCDSCAIGKPCNGV